MSDLLRSVSERWYVLFWSFILLVAVFAVAGGLATHYFPAVSDYTTTWGLTTFGASVGGLLILYRFSIYIFVARSSKELGMLVGAMALSLITLSGLVNSGHESATSWLYVAIWLMAAFLVGMFGVAFNFGSVLLGAIYAILQTKSFSLPFGEANIVLLVGTVILSALSALFWRQRFSNPNAVQLKNLSKLLKSNQEQSVILIRSIADGVIVTDTDGNISLSNQSASNITGWTIQESSGVAVRQVLKLNTEKGEPLKEADYPFDSVLEHKAFINQTLQVTARNGRQRIISLVISPVVTQSGEVYGAVAVMRDVSEQRAAEQQRAEFISTASHEMRTPVAAIEGYLALALNDKVSTIDERAKSYLQKAHANTKHLGKLFQDLLTSAKAEDGRLPSRPQPVELGSLLEQLVEDLGLAAAPKKLSVDFVVGGNKSTTDDTTNPEGIKVVKPLYYALVDPERIREGLTNLFDNAIKYTNPQGKITIGITGNQELVQISVSDTGVGIPAEDIPHLFQKFYRVDNSATRVIGGTGLGLFICRKIVELYGGRIWVQSQLGKGSTFYVNLPRLSSQKAQTAGSQTPASHPAN